MNTFMKFYDQNNFLTNFNIHLCYIIVGAHYEPLQKTLLKYLKKTGKNRPIIAIVIDRSLNIIKNVKFIKIW